MRGVPTRILLAFSVAACLGAGWWRFANVPSTSTADELADRALRSPTVAEQTAAAITLADHGDQALAALQRVFDKSTEPDVQIVSMQGLAKRWDYQRMDEFLDLAAAGPAKVRGRAAQVVMRMTGRQRPYSSSAPASEREVLVQHMRADWNEIQRASAEDRAELIRRLRESHEQQP